MDILLAAIKLNKYEEVELDKDVLTHKVNGVRKTFTDEELQEINSKAQELHAVWEADSYKRERRQKYMEKSPYEQIEMMVDGTFNAWYQGIKNSIPKPQG